MTSATNAHDRELVRAYVREGSESAFSELARRHQRMMQATARRIGGDSEEALDAMQRALIVFARRAGEIRAEEAGVGPWLHRAVTLEAMALRRQRLKRRSREQEAMQTRQESNGGMSPEIAAELDGVIDGLPEKDREAILLHYFEGLTFRDIARKLGGTEAAWQKRGARALSKLAGLLRRRGFVVTTTALGTWMTATRADAGISVVTLTPMVREALRNPLSASVPLKATPVLFLIMNMKIALTSCFVGGIVLSYAWSERASLPRTNDHSGNLRTTASPHSGRPLRQGWSFSIKAVATAVGRFDSLGRDDPAFESQLRAMMFGVPEEHLEAVRNILGGVENVGRFHEIAAAFYARWAEIDPETAWDTAAGAEPFAEDARRGVLLTWLNTDADAALLRLQEERRPGDLGILEEFVDVKAQHDPRGAAGLVDRLAEAWPEADKMLFPKVSQAWAQADPAGAGEWVSSYWDREVRNDMLRQLSQLVARSKGRQGFGLADRIDDPESRTAARVNAARWWGISSGGPSLSSKNGDPDLDLTGGFPGEWSGEEIRAFSLGTMANYSKNYPELIAIAKGVGQQQAVYEGVITGASFSQPAFVAGAVESVDVGFVGTPDGRKGLTSFILRWSEVDPSAAKTWLESQPANPKTQLMRDAMTNHPNP